MTETYDCSRAPEWLRRAVKGGTRWVRSMTVTLEKLDEQSRRYQSRRSQRLIGAGQATVVCTV